MINYKIRLNKESKLDNDSNLKYYNIERKTKMNKINPNFILRSSILNSAIIEAKKNNFTLINKLYDLLKSPYDEITNEDELFFKICCLFFII